VDRLRSGLRISAFFKFSQRLSGRISTVGLSHGFMTNIVHHVPGGGFQARTIWGPGPLVYVISLAPLGLFTESTAPSINVLSAAELQ